MGLNDDLPQESEENPIRSEDCVGRDTDTNLRGIVTRVATESEDDYSDEDEDQVPDGHALVEWFNLQDNDVQEKCVEPVSTLKLLDRSFLNGDAVCRSVDGQTGLALRSRIQASVRLFNPSGDGPAIAHEVQGHELASLHEYGPEVLVCCGKWLGRVIDTFETSILKFPNQGVALFDDEDLEDVEDFSFEGVDSLEYVHYPGLAVSSKKWDKHEQLGTLVFVKGKRGKEQTAECTSMQPKKVEVEWLSTFDSFSARVSGANAPPTTIGVHRLRPLRFTYEDSGDWTVGDVAAIVRDKLGPSPPADTPPECGVVIETKSTIDVMWQDGHLERNVPGTELDGVDHPDVRDFFPGDFVTDTFSTPPMVPSTNTAIPFSQSPAASRFAQPLESSGDAQLDATLTAFHELSSSLDGPGTDESANADTAAFPVGSEPRVEVPPNARVGVVRSVNQAERTCVVRWLDSDALQENSDPPASGSCGCCLCVCDAHGSNGSITLRDPAPETMKPSYMSLRPVAMPTCTNHFDNSACGCALAAHPPHGHCGSTCAQASTTYSEQSDTASMFHSPCRHALNEEELSVYAVMHHPEYNFSLNDIAVALIPENEASTISSPLDGTGGSKCENDDDAKELRLPNLPKTRGKGSQMARRAAARHLFAPWINYEHLTLRPEPIPRAGSAWIGEIVGIHCGLVDIAWIDGSVTCLRPSQIFMTFAPEDLGDMVMDDDEYDDEYDDDGDQGDEDSGWETASDDGNDLKDEAEDVDDGKASVASDTNQVETEGATEGPDHASDDEDSDADDNFEADPLGVFVLEPSPPSDHHFLFPSNASSSLSSKAVHREWRLLARDLPAGVFVRAYEMRTDLLRAMIVGPEDTPYHDVIFAFDIQLPDTYPARPPRVHYRALVPERLNPNLYEEGRVCLSLLGTWFGENESEEWVPASSSLLQILVSIQGIVLCSHPYFQEAGYERQKGGREGTYKTSLYNETAFLKSLEALMVVAQRPVAGFEALIKHHIANRNEAIMDRCEEILALGDLDTSTPAESQGLPGGDQRPSWFRSVRLSRGFVLHLRALLPKLRAALCSP